MLVAVVLTFGSNHYTAVMTPYCHETVKTPMNEDYTSSATSLSRSRSTTHATDDKHHDHAASLYTCLSHLPSCIVFFAIVAVRLVACLCLSPSLQQTGLILPLSLIYCRSEDNTQEAYISPEQADIAVSSGYYCCFFWTDN